MKFLGFLFLLWLILVPFVQSCMDDTPPEHPDDINITAEKIETQVLPAAPTTKDEVSFITYDCKYYVLSSVLTRGKSITVKKRFNSMMKLPCVLVHDTIALGLLKQGSYTLTFLIIDSNPAVADSISFRQTLNLVVER
jgi:hypothetical protein